MLLNLYVIVTMTDWVRCRVFWCIRQQCAVVSLTPSPGEQAAQSRQEVGLGSKTSWPTFPGDPLSCYFPKRWQQVGTKSSNLWACRVMHFQSTMVIPPKVNWPLWVGFSGIPFSLGAPLVCFPVTNMGLQNGTGCFLWLLTFWDEKWDKKESNR